MKDILVDIRNRISNGEFANEEQVRLSIVCRILQTLGWNIWNTKELYPEFPVARNEDATKVDVALFLNSYSPPSVFIEIKAVGEFPRNLGKIEIQLRDYNRNNTAPFSIATDGRMWYFYYSQTGGEFSNKRFKEIDILNDNVDDIELYLSAFLSRKEIESGAARLEAEKYLQLSQEQRAMEDCLFQARRMVQDPPFPALPDCLIELVKVKGFVISREKVIGFIKDSPEKKIVDYQIGEQKTPITNGIITSTPQRGKITTNVNGDKKNTEVIEANIDSHAVKSWRQLYRVAISLALKKGSSVQSIKNIIGGGIMEGSHEGSGYKPLEGLNVSVQDVDANGCFNKAKALSEQVGFSLYVLYEDQNGQQFEIKY